MRRTRLNLYKSGFSLMEVVIALSIIATCFVALLGLLPAGLHASHEAANSTIVATVFEEVHNRLQNRPLRVGVVELTSAPLDVHGLSPLYFDDHGIAIPPDAGIDDLARRLYRADVRLADWQKRPANTKGLRTVIAELSWPVDAKGEALGKGNPKSRVTYCVTALTGPDWTAIYPPKVPEWKYEEKIEF